MVEESTVIAGHLAIVSSLKQLKEPVNGTSDIGMELATAMLVDELVPPVLFKTTAAMSA